MSKYYEIKDLKVRVSDHEPNFSMDKFRGVNDIELYTKSADSKTLNIEDQINKILESDLAQKHGLTKKDFSEVLGKKERANKLSKAYKTIDSWFANPDKNSDLIKDLKKNPNWFIPADLNKSQKESWLNYLNSKILKQTKIR